MSVETFLMMNELPRWRLSLSAAGRKQATIDNYTRSVEQFHAYLSASGMPTDLASITRDSIRAFTVSLRDEQHQAASTIALRFKSLSVFFRWAEDETLIERTPFRRLATPAIPQVYKEVLSHGQIRHLLMLADGPSFTAKRNVAAIYLLYDTGARVGELLGLGLGDWDANSRTLTIRNSKTRPRVVRVGAAAGVALGRYLRLRERHLWRDSPFLFLGRQGPWTDSGCRDTFQQLQARSGIDIHPHALRHAWANSVMASGMSDRDIMYAGGWSSMKMLTSVYAVSQAGERSIAAMEGHSPADDL
jgi:site-specific recombinase XerD